MSTVIAIKPVAENKKNSAIGITSYLARRLKSQLVWMMEKIVRNIVPAHGLVVFALFSPNSDSCEWGYFHPIENEFFIENMNEILWSIDDYFKIINRCYEETTGSNQNKIQYVCNCFYTELSKTYFFDFFYPNKTIIRDLNKKLLAKCINEYLEAVGNDEIR